MISFRGVDFSYRRGWFRPQVTPVLHRVDWNVPKGQIIALVGPSGSGKSTLIKLALGLATPQAGEIHISNINRHNPNGTDAMRLAKALQWVPQHPDASFDPRMTMETSLREALAVHDIRGAAAKDRIANEVERLHLSSRLLTRRPSALSGGEVQRFALARALVLEPSALLLDEPTSMLDVSVQAEIVRLIMRLNADNGLTIVLVTHDRYLARHAATRIDRIEAGRLLT